jgi:hypothetical protein
LSLKLTDNDKKAAPEAKKDIQTLAHIKETYTFASDYLNGWIVPTRKQ